MHPEHAELLARLNEHALVGAPTPHGNDSYTSSGRPHLRVPVPARRLVARAWLTQNRALPTADVLAVVDSLFAGESHDEKTLGALLLAAHPTARAAVSPGEIDAWLDQLRGWAEIDTLCQNVFKADEIITRWDEWNVLLTALAHDENIYKRRAALVFLVGPVQHSADERLRALAFATIGELKSERDGVITKAVSWLLRALTTGHRDDVVAYLAAEEASLPRIAVRETRTKLRTGKKTNRSRATNT